MLGRAYLRISYLIHQAIQVSIVGRETKNPIEACERNLNRRRSLRPKGPKARLAVSSAAVGALAVLIIGGAVALYYYTQPTALASSTSSTLSRSSTAAISTTVFAFTNSSGTFYYTNSTDTQGLSGYCVTNANGQCTHPEGVWNAYLGYVPSGYVLVPHEANAFTYPCPPGMDSPQCKIFQQSCGNGVCDPNESCATCPADCGVGGQLTCDPYSGRVGGPISICLGNYCNPNLPP